MAWSPPIITGMAPAFKIALTAAYVLAGLFCAGVDNIGVANVDDADTIHGQVGGIILVIIRAAVAE